ncbi:U32 family peptidase [Roseimicrobium sp. ORNL1]|uniref:U32 family peptidase n=1 Tax=Roseimicrobium sp. ORNL1 TaxID=2711231 RepID=UPI0013E127AD|nr:U32 family peptidase [Roseimicrobium sp. ORNL1]QIF00821.1 U32 family peptidase [Roseimicrobium sp. ORNL1]
MLSIPVSEPTPILNYKPELLSPAGNWECARAAVANGADAIYFGMPRFNARLRADNFTEEDLPKLMEFLHKHGVRGYCAFNTLIFTGEIEDAEKQLKLLESAGVDAVIIQDLGLARIVKACTPKLHLHASTQMTITSPEGLRFAKNLGLDLAVLSRELSLRELEAFQKQGGENALPLEVFVHGALCVAYSGQCLTSESLGRRSANRGECAQACRMPYELVVDGELQDLGDKRYLLSPQDLAAVNEIPELIKLGVRSFKIEGRLKTPEYVAAVTQVYRKAMDAAFAEMAGLPHGEAFSAKDKYALEMTFSRGLFSGWMHGVNHQELVGAKYAKKRGPFVGEVRYVDRDAVELTDFATPLKPGDGVVFENPSDTNREQGGYLYGVHENWIEFQRGKIDFRGVKPGTRVFKTSDMALEKELQSSFKGDIPIRKRLELHLRVSGSLGAPLVLEALDADEKVTARVESTILLDVARNRPLTREGLQAQLERLGGTPYELRHLDVFLPDNAILPVSELNRLRRDLVEKLEQGATAASSVEVKPATTAAEMLAAVPKSRTPISSPVLHVLCRSMDQIEAALDANVQRMYVDFEDIRLYNDAVRLVRESGRDGLIFLATPRIQKAREDGFFKLIARAEPDGVLIRNLGAIEFFANAGLRMTGDFSLNVANPLTAEFLINSGLEQCTISYDLNIEQVLDLLKGAPPEWFEITLHQHMPMFHMEHCVFASFMSEGKSFLDCGRPCEKHNVKLRDRVGMEHPLKADVGCRNTLFNAVAQTGALFFQDLMNVGLRHYRVELLEETRRETAIILSTYNALLTGRTSGVSLHQALKAQSQLGVTTGTLRQGEFR